MKSNFNQDKLEFRQIVLKHLQKILEISASELRNTSREIIGNNFSRTIEEEDTKISYIQAIENLAYVLAPYFDEKIKEVYEECIKIVNSFGFQLREEILKKEYVELCKKLGEEKVKSFFTEEMKLEYAKKLFIELNLLLKRNDYLKSSIYGEDKDEVVEEK